MDKTGSEYPYFNYYYKKGLKIDEDPEAAKRWDNKLVIGIHGLAPKVPENVLKEYWYKAITDGLIYNKYGKKYGTLEERNSVLPWECFKMAYWAKLIYKHPVKKETEPYLPYKEPPKKREEHYSNCGISMRKCFTDVAGCLCDSFRKEVGSKCSEILASKVGHFNDATDYWGNEFTRSTGKVKSSDIRACLRDIITDALKDNHNKQILILAHSMGTMISYDVLDALETPYTKNITFVTLGSPLGMPTVKSHVRSTSSVGTKCKNWVNFSDMKDPVCFDAFLEDDYYGVKDVIVCNEYEYLDKHTQKPTINSHKSIGYLRCPEATKCIENFINE